MVTVTFQINEQELKTCELQTVQSLKHSIDICMRICGLTKTDDLCYTSNAKKWVEQDTQIFLEFENHGDILEYLKSWTIEDNEGKHDILKMYNENRKPYFEKFIKPRREAERRRIAEERIKRLKNKTDNDDE